MNILLISANSYHIIKNLLRKFIQNKSFEIINFNNSSIEDIINEASSSSLFEDNKILLINNSDFFGKTKLKEKEENLLINYLNNPNPKTTLIFTTLNDVDKRKKIVKIISTKYKIVIVDPWDKRKIRDEINIYFNKYGFQADYNTVTYIMNNIYNNIDVLYNELDKIMLFYNKKCKIDYDDIVNIIGRETEDNIWLFVNNVIGKNLVASVKNLKDLQIYKIDATMVIPLLAREYRLIYYLKNLKKLNISLDSLMKEFNLKDWQINNIYNNSLKYNNKEVLDNIKLLSNIDLQIKNGNYNKNTILYSIILQVCI